MKKIEGYRRSIIDEILDSITDEESMRTSKRMSLAMKIDEAMKAKRRKNKDLANALDKELSVITKWLSGTHNFTVDTLCDIERVLNIEIINVDIKPKIQKISVVNLSISKENEIRLPNYWSQIYNYNQLSVISNNLMQYKS